MNIDDMKKTILQRVNEYDYKNDVSNRIIELKKQLEKEDNITFKLKYRSLVVNRNNKDDLIKGISDSIIIYKIEEKALFNLMSQGLIYPVSTCDGNMIIDEDMNLNNSFRYSININSKINIERLVFDKFKKV